MTGQPRRQVAGGIWALAIAMGVGRFAYTPILPLMQQELHFSDAFAGYLASSNYAGYMLGALLAGVIPWHGRRALYYRIGLTASVLTTAAMGMTHSPSLWFALRFASGIVSAFVFVLASAMVLDVLAARGKTAWSGLFYGGVGAGILASGLLTPLFARLGSWQGAWIGLGLFSAVGAVFAWMWVQEGESASGAGKTASDSAAAPPARWLPWLIASYGLEGLGYIVTGTFIVAIADQIPGFAGHSIWVWVLVGAAAAPSCILWSSLAKKLGFVRTLLWSMLLQAAGIALPAWWSAPGGFVISALLFGATFMGITTLAATLGRQMSPNRSSRVIGILTAVYGTGQMLGPAGAGALFSLTGDYNGALLGAAAVVLAGGCLLLTGLRYDKQRRDRDNALRQH
ncbi:Major Facilitator Superfamily protein [Paenibacillus konkukensis]|uniref:Major Facilitator Superfamily protein n=1 Tax=Paenibacillus konkukensis TaxID=2020716 RepID=A0ABY4RTN7_9BACL|nr:YbfB/YjiJ family MFS transporter [Paenibacillus konkukensis]UQZ85812.1 Major Facilitator Superfamily protein [Paenibacillus konkukensis]